MKNEINNPFLSKGTEIKSISVSRPYADLARQYHISWSEAARVGFSLILAEMGIEGYDNKLNIHRKMMQFQKLAEDSMNELNELKEKLDSKESDNAKPQL